MLCAPRGTVNRETNEVVENYELGAELSHVTASTLTAVPLVRSVMPRRTLSDRANENGRNQGWPE